MKLRICTVASMLYSGHTIALYIYVRSCNKSSVATYQLGGTYLALLYSAIITSNINIVLQCTAKGLSSQRTQSLIRLCVCVLFHMYYDVCRHADMQRQDGQAVVTPFIKLGCFSLVW